MASVRKRKWEHKGVEQEAWVVSYTDLGGKRRLKTFEKKKDADRYRTQVEVEIERGTHTAASESVAFSIAVEAFLKECDKRVQMRDITLGTLKNYESNFKVAITPYFAKVKMCDVSADLVQAFVNEMRLRYQPATIHGHYMTLTTLMSFAVRRRWMKFNPLRDQPARLPEKPKRKAIPSKADMHAILRTARRRLAGGDLNLQVTRHVFVALALFGGLRPGEVYGLQWEDVDFDGGVVHVRHSLSRTDGLKGPKSAAGIRDVPMSAPMREALLQAARYHVVRALATAPTWKGKGANALSARTYRLWKSDAVHVDTDELSGFVVRTRNGGPRISEDSTDFWHSFMKEAGLYDSEAKRPKFTPHALRHAAASLFIEAGLPPLNLKTVIGHKDVNTTYNIYGHLFPEDKRIQEASEAIAAQIDATSAQHGPLTH